MAAFAIGGARPTPGTLWPLSTLVIPIGLGSPRQADGLVIAYPFSWLLHSYYTVLWIGNSSQKFEFDLMVTKCFENVHSGPKRPVETPLGRRFETHNRAQALPHGRNPALYGQSRPKPGPEAVMHTSVCTFSARSMTTSTRIDKAARQFIPPKQQQPSQRRQRATVDARSISPPAARPSERIMRGSHSRPRIGPPFELEDSKATPHTNRQEARGYTCPRPLIPR